MAKRRKGYTKKARTKSRSSGFNFFKKKGRSKSKSGSSVKMIQFDSMAYGAVRGQIANLITPVTNMIPMGDIADELGMGLVCYFAAKNMNGMVRDVAIKGLVIENARLGEALLGGLLSGITGTANKKSDEFAYG